MQHVPEEWTEPEEERKRSDGGQTEQTEECETLMMELTRLVHKTVRDSSWWDRRGLDCTILASAFISLPIAFLLLSSSQVCYFLLGLVLMGVAHAVITVKGTHLASHGALSESSAWRQFWAVFFIEVCGAFTARAGVKAHIKMHHAHTNVIGLGDSSTWKIPFLPRGVYLFLAPLAVPIITPVVAMAERPASVHRSAYSGVCVCRCVFTLCAAAVCIRVGVELSAAGDAAEQSHVLHPLHPRQHLPAHWFADVFSESSSQAYLPDEPRSVEPAEEPAAGLDLWSLAHQLPCGASPVPLAVRQHVPEGEANRVAVPEGEGVAVSGGRLSLSSSSLLPQVPGADGVCSSNH
ncbi:fatty acid desaturase 6 isoform X2 [Hemibagrus wyckioides]|uniref:fatty acid desaturase 6 isoform X2 n=1 Tax=Hemibagrus wyckioides TaxID=337641 RepID=UPI00266B70EB|nr:fatty acid desaturase 6 isoform X2 [Hemibagrus wyckioides]